MKEINIKLNAKEIQTLAEKMKRGYFCEQACYGCCGDNEIDLTCSMILKNLNNYLLKESEEQQ